MWQGINNITGFKGNKPATVNIAASQPDEFNTFYAHFEADTTAHTESAPAAAAEEVSPLSLSVADVTRSFKRVNVRKAVVRWSEWATTPHLPWSSTLMLRRAASSAHSCTPCTHMTVQLHTAPMSLSNLLMTQR